MSVEIRKELEEDIENISRVVEAAFQRKLEADLVTLNRSRGESLLQVGDFIQPNATTNDMGPVCSLWR